MRRLLASLLLALAAILVFGGCTSAKQGEGRRSGLLGARATPTASVAPTPEPHDGAALARTIIDSGPEATQAGRILPIGLSSAIPSRRPQPVRLMIPRLALDTRVVELGTKRDAQGELIWETAAFAAGHHRGTANPGDRGNMVISGHISSRFEGAAFHLLPEVIEGDGVVVSTADRDYLYRVISTTTVEPNAIAVMEATAREQLTLITCVPDGIYTQRLVVVAVPITG